MAKRKKARRREPNGRPQRAVAAEREYPPSLVARLRDAAIHRYGDKRWGSQLGRLYLLKHIDDRQMAAGERWSTLAAKYHVAINSPPAHPHSINLQTGLHALAPDPDSELGREIAATESGAIRRMRRAHAALQSAGASSEELVRQVCEYDESCPAWCLENFRAGLSRLANHFWPDAKLTERANHVR